MKKLILLALAVSAILTFTACDSDEPADKGDETVVGAGETVDGGQEETPEEPKVELKNTIKFGFDGLGNDPNNHWQSAYAPAFDSEYIYYIHKGNLYSSIYRVGYNGGTPERLVEDADAYLNVYDGALYYTLEGSGSNPYAKLMKLDLETREETLIFEVTGKKWVDDYCFDNILITQGYAFFTIHDTGNNEYTWIYAVDLANTSSVYMLYFERADRDTALVTDGEGTIYALTKADGSNANRRKLMKLAVSDLTDYGYKASFYTILGERDLPAFATFIWGKNGYMAFGSQYRNYFYDEINVDEDKWYAGKDNYEDLEQDSMAYKLMSTRGQRYVIGNSLIILGTDIVYAGSDVLGDTSTGLPMYICKNMDLANPEEIARFEKISFISNSPDNAFGVYNDKFYLINNTDEGKYLVTVTPDGEITRAVIEQ